MTGWAEQVARIVREVVAADDECTGRRGLLDPDRRALLRGLAVAEVRDTLGPPPGSRPHEANSVIWHAVWAVVAELTNKERQAVESAASKFTQNLRDYITNEEEGT